MYLKNKHLQCEKLDFNAKDLVINGWYKSKSNNIKEFPPDEIENIKLKAINNLTKSVNIYVHNISKSNEKFAHLMCIKTNYENRNPILSLGTIIKIDEANKQLFLFCIQPRCDCVRINKKENNFIFIPLVQIKSKSKYNREQLIICIDNNEYIRFKVQIKANCLYNIIIIQDKIGKNNPIITKQGENNEYYFTGIINGNEKKFKWICEVKDDIAQKYANDLAANLSRVGVDLPEWMAINK